MRRVLFILFFVAAAWAGEPIRLLEVNPRYFLYRGKPTVLITSGEHYGAVLNTAFDYERYLETLAADGLNLTRVFSGAYVEKPGAFGIVHNVLAPKREDYLPPWPRSGQPGALDGLNKFDLARFNPAYFERLKGFLRSASKRGIVVELVLFSSIYDENNWTMMPFHPQNNINGTECAEFRRVHTLDNGGLLPYQENMVRRIVREVNEFDNIYFEIQNEPWSDRPDSAGVILEHLTDDVFVPAGARWQNRLDLADEASLAWQKRIAEIIADEESRLPNRHLIAQNYVNFFYPLNRVEPEISILNFHYALPQAALLNSGWKRPVSFDESGFAGPDPDVYRRQAWRFLLSGGAVFNGLDYSFYPGFEDGSGDISGPGGGGSVLRRQLAVLRRFLERFDLGALQPDLTTVQHAPGLIPYLLSDAGKQYAGWFEGRGAGIVALRLPKGNYLVQWLEPRTGELLRRERLSSNGRVAVTLRLPAFDGEIAMDLRHN